MVFTLHNSTKVSNDHYPPVTSAWLHLIKFTHQI